MDLLDVYILYKSGRDSDAAHAAHAVAKEKFGVDLPPSKALVFVLSEITNRLVSARIENAIVESIDLDAAKIDELKKTTEKEVFDR